MTQWIERDQLALDNCDREPIHRPGRIQPFGALIAGPVDLSRVDFVSENVAEIVGHAPGELLGASMAGMFDRGLIHDLRNLLTLSTSRTQRERAGTYDINERRIEVFVHRNGSDQAIIEFEPTDEAAPARFEKPIDQMRLILAQAGQQRDLDRFLTVCVHGLRDLIGYDRVKAYRYWPGGDGEVVAEARGPGVESFMGLRYPAWDVPAQARALQVKNPVRMLSNVKQQPVGLLGHDADPEHLDIALAHTRGISPIHVEYLINMGVGATLTIGLIVEGKLWGMFACHHMSPRTIGSDVRIAAELFGQMISLIIQQKLELEATDARSKAEEARRRILAETDAATDLLHSFPELSPILRDVISCDGLAVLREGKLQTTGSVPEPAAIHAIGDRLPDEDNLLADTDCLVKSGWASSGDLNATGGCLHLRCTAAAPLQIMFFRNEKVRTIKWAGKPQKDVAVGPMGARLTPRGSFASYLEEQQGYAPDWNSYDLEAGRELQKLLTQITTKGERAQMQRHTDMLNHQRQQDLMIAELNHRVKNILALIRSLSRQAKQSSASLESYAQALEQRISALAAAHDLAVSNTMQGVSLRGLLQTELGPYIGDDNMQVLMAGPMVGLRADVAPMIALVMHEVVTNAAKYGALSTPDGVVQSRWTQDDEGLHFSWKEMNGPEVEPPKRHGFGQSLIERAIPYEFDGTVALDYAPGGVNFSFTLPAETLADVTEESTSRIVGTVTEVKNVASGRSVLLVEDNMVLAMDMVESLTRMGAAQVETAGSLEEAMRAARRQDYDFAVLDMNLRGALSFDVARLLREGGTPFLFVTGYGSSMDMPEDLSDVPIMTKPIADGTLSAGLSSILAG